MPIIFHCFGGAHSSVTAASIYLGLLPGHRRPTVGEILGLPYFDARPDGREGELLFLGRDAAGHDVYCAGKRYLGYRFTALIKALLEALAIDASELTLINTFPCVNPLMAAGGYASRRLKLVRLGRPLVARGTVLAYGCLQRLASQVRPPLAAQPRQAACGAVVYACPTGSYLAVIAAARHLGWLGSGPLPAWEELKALPGFAEAGGKGLKLIGADGQGRRVYALAVGRDGRVIASLIPSLLKVLGLPETCVTFVDLAAAQTPLLRLGAALRRSRLGEVLGDWLVERELRLAWDRLAPPGARPRLA